MSSLLESSALSCEGYAAVLSADLHWVADRNEAGFVAGWLQSANVFLGLHSEPFPSFPSFRLATLRTPAMAPPDDSNMTLVVRTLGESLDLKQFCSPLSGPP